MNWTTRPINHVKFYVLEKKLGFRESKNSVVPGSVQVPENRTREQKSFLTGPKTARISESVLETEPEPPKALGQFQNLIFLECQLQPYEYKYSFFNVS